MIKLKLTTTPLFVILDFKLLYEFHCDASKIGIGVVLGKPVAFFSEKLSGSRLNYCTYDVEFYALVQSLKQWSSYLAYNEFILYSDPEALKHHNSQDKLSFWHVKWASYVQQFSFTVKHKLGALIKVIEVLSRKSTLLTTMKSEVINFEFLNYYLSTDHLIGSIVVDVSSGMRGDFGLHNGFLFKGIQLCILDCSLRLKIIQERHNLNFQNTIILMFYWFLLFNIS